jgi:hypothetical protein
VAKFISGVPGRYEQTKRGRGQFGLYVDDVDVMKLYKAINNVEKELRADINGRLRDAAGESANDLAQDLRQASAFGPPQAALVAQTIKVRRDRIPKVAIGGSKRVGHRKTVAGKLLFGSERGGRNFQRPSGGNYWIKPTVDRFLDSSGYTRFYKAVVDILTSEGLL